MAKTPSGAPIQRTHLLFVVRAAVSDEAIDFLAGTKGLRDTPSSPHPTSAALRVSTEVSSVHGLETGKKVRADEGIVWAGPGPRRHRRAGALRLDHLQTPCPPLWAPLGSRKG